MPIYKRPSKYLTDRPNDANDDLLKQWRSETLQENWNPNTNMKLTEKESDVGTGRSMEEKSQEPPDVAKAFQNAGKALQKGAAKRDADAKKVMAENDALYQQRRARAMSLIQSRRGVRQDVNPMVNPMSMPQGAAGIFPFVNNQMNQMGGGQPMPGGAAGIFPFAMNKLRMG